jgi:hypothetical protein
VSPITITRPQRDAIYGELLVDLTAIGDIYVELDNGNYDTAKRYRREFEDDLRLLDDLGWEPEAPGEQFEITVPADQLVRVMERLHRLASNALATHVRRPEDDECLAERKVVACGAYGSVLAQLTNPTTRRAPSAQR